MGWSYVTIPVISMDEDESGVVSSIIMKHQRKRHELDEVMKIKWKLVKEHEQPEQRDNNFKDDK